MSRGRLVLLNPSGDPIEEVSLGTETTIGRGNESHLALVDRLVSRRHAVITFDPEGGYVLSDLGSANGSLLNGRRLVAPARLQAGDVVTFGESRFQFWDDESPKATEALTRGGGTTSLLAGRPDAVLVGRSPSMADVFELIGKAGSSDIPVLIEGETGTGKELVARAIHQASAREGKMFQPINCAAIPADLLESELFGHRRGAFTGATADRRGLIEGARGGTLFLDEVAEMPLSMQPKLLRVLQEGEVTRLGENDARPVDVRLIAATNRDLLAEVDGGRFRADLYYRLSAFPVCVPSLRDRPEDIPLLSDIFLGVFSRQQQKRVAGISSEALQALCGHGWPGNVRELRNEIQRAVTLVRSGQPVGPEHLLQRRPEARPALDPIPREETPAPRPVDTLGEARRAFELRYISDVIEREGHVLTSVAKTLGLSRAGLYKKLKELGLR